MTSQEAARIASVAHLFLSELRHPDETAKIPERRKPNSDSHPPPPQQADQPARADPLYFLPEAEESALPASPVDSDRRLRVLAVLASHLRWEGAKGLVQFARHLASAGRSAALLRLEPSAAHLRLFYHKDLGGRLAGVLPAVEGDHYAETPRGPRETPVGPESGGRCIWDLLERLSQQVDYLLIAADAGCFEPVGRAVLSYCHTVCILAHPEKDHLVASYQTVKTIGAEFPGRSIGAFVTQAHDQEQARSIFSRLDQTARRFAKTGLIDFGYTLSDQNVSQELLCRADLAGNGDHDRRDCARRLEEFLTELVEEFPGSQDEEAGACEALAEAPAAVEAEASAPAEAQESVKHVESAPMISDIRSETDNGNGHGAGGLVAVDLDGDPRNGQVLPQRLAGELLGDVKICGDTFTEFLANCGLRCCLARVGERSSLVILIRDEQDLQTAAWALGNYPQSEQTLILITAVAVDAPLHRSWSRRFAKTQIVRGLEGRLDGRRMFVLERPSRQ
ncbi:MAG: MinD/ParA family protein [Phycisphaerae bacterium]|nr:MinD/ParA family protein [Phycisphaerae bacterium]